MTRGRARTHLDASVAGQRRRALCGWIEVDCETDASRVTCKTCLSLLGRGRSQAPQGGRAAGQTALDASALETALAGALLVTCSPSAGPPPRVTPQVWAASCKGGEHRRCGMCELCVWEREAAKWDAVSPWNRVLRVERPAGLPRWPSLAAALTALVEWERHGRTAPSALGGVLDCLRRGELGDGGRARPDDPLLRRAGELVRVRQALELAYPDGAHQVLSSGQCRALLLVRTPGVLVEMPDYEALALELASTVSELRALVRGGRRAMTDELVARGLIPAVRARRKVEASGSRMRVDIEAVGGAPCAWTGSETC